MMAVQLIMAIVLSMGVVSPARDTLNQLKQHQAHATRTPGLATPFRPTVYSGCNLTRTSGAGCVWLIRFIAKNGNSKLPVVVVLADVSV